MEKFDATKHIFGMAYKLNEISYPRHVVEEEGIIFGCDEQDMDEDSCLYLIGDRVPEFDYIPRATADKLAEALRKLRGNCELHHVARNIVEQALNEYNAAKGEQK